MTESFDNLLRQAEVLHAKKPDRERRGRLGLYESFLRHERKRLRQRHGLGAGGREIARAHAALTDAVLRHLFDALLSDWRSHHAKTAPPAVALVALGGYGRGELNPFSDIDLLALHEDSRQGRTGDAFVRAIHDGLVVPLYDLGFHVGWATRSVRQTIAQANKDMETKTSLIEARFLVGERPLFEELQEKLLKRCVLPCVEEYIEQRMKDQAERHAKFSNNVSVQEPNIKSGCGGLRDLQNLLWMSFFKHGARTLEEMVARGFLTRDEQQSLESAYDFLLRTRTQLHYVAERPMDVLTLAFQAPVATGLRYEVPDLLRRVEHFMRDYLRHAKHVFQLTNALALRMALKPPGYFERLGIHVPILGRGVKVEAKDGFIIRGNVIEPQSREIFREDPFRIIRVFRHAQQRQAFLSPELQALVREYLRSVNEDFRRHEHARETFLAILSEAGSVGRTLRLMHEASFLGRFVPEFVEMDTLVQHEFFHLYTADEHTLVTLERLDAVVAATEGPELEYKRVFHEITRPELLYLALLLHDVGKAANAPSHTEVSVAMAAQMAERLGMDDAGREMLLFLVRHHLTMWQYSHRHDLDDNEAITEFARLVENQQRLTGLLVMTYADMTGTSADIWNEWRNSLLWELFLKTRAELVGGAESQALQEQRLQTMLQHIRERSPVPAGEVAAHFEKMQRRYFLTFTADDVLRHLQVIHRFLERAIGPASHALTPVVDWTDKPDRGYSQVTICTWDREGLFSKICGSFSYAGLNILNAHAYSRYDGIVLDIFNVAEATEGVVSDRDQQRQFERTLDQALNHGANLDQLLARHRPKRRAGHAPQGQVRTEVRVDLTASRTRTVIDVQAEDRLGLLYTIAQTLARNGLDINLARIATERGAAIDTFYVVDKDGRKVLDNAWLNRAQSELERAIEELRRRPITGGA